jgi:hypothetical protein
MRRRRKIGQALFLIRRQLPIFERCHGMRGGRGGQATGIQPYKRLRQSYVDVVEAAGAVRGAAGIGER